MLHLGCLVQFFSETSLFAQCAAETVDDSQHGLHNFQLADEREGRVQHRPEERRRFREQQRRVWGKGRL